MTVEEFAAAYGITFRNVTRIPKEHCIPNSKLGVGCILEEKVVLIDPEMQKATKFQSGDLSDRKELVLHEVVHIIVQPPHMDIRVVPELAILLQFEQAVGQFLMPAMYEPIEHFQMPTDIKFRGRGHRRRQVAMTNARAIPEVVVEVLMEDPLRWLHVSCPDFSAFQSLPLLVRFKGRRYSRRGWNSDCQRAYYQPGTDNLAFAETP